MRAKKSKNNNQHRWVLPVVLIMTVMHVNAALNVRAVSSRPALLFSENEACAVRALVSGGAGNAMVDFVVRAAGRAWSQKGNITISRQDGESAEALLPIKLPGRGYYSIELTARAGGESAKHRSAIGIIFAPLPIDSNSPWGMMWAPMGSPYSKKDNVDTETAEVMAIMGIAWVRVNFWESTYKVSINEKGEMVLDLSTMKNSIKAMRKAGLHIMGEFVMTPRVLSSKPDDLTPHGDCGPMYCRVRPADWGRWEEMISRIAREFKDDIGVWEIWNEPDSLQAFFVGMPEGFVELVDHTAKAIRTGNPNAKIASAGFVGNSLRKEPLGKDVRRQNIEAMFDAGFGKQLDIFTFHYTDEHPSVIEDWRVLLNKHGLTLPIWNSEERSVVPLENLSRGIRSFKFLLIGFEYANYIPILQKDWTITPATVAYATGARLIGSKPFVRRAELPRFTVYYFGSGKDSIAAITATATATNEVPSLFRAIDSLQVSIEAWPDMQPIGYDALGRSREIDVKTGENEVPFRIVNYRDKAAYVPTPVAYVSGAKNISSVHGRSACIDNGIVVEAERSTFSPGWSVVEKSNYSGGKILNIWADSDPDAAGYWVDMKIDVPVAGKYEVLFSGTTLARLKSPPTLSPFAWKFDGGGESFVTNVLPAIQGIDGAPEGLFVLGSADLSVGEHIFHLRLLESCHPPRPYQNESRWALWFDAIALMPVE